MTSKIDPEYQRHLKKVAEEVNSSPKWKQGGIGVANPKIINRALTRTIKSTCLVDRSIPGSNQVCKQIVDLCIGLHNELPTKATR